MCLTIVEVGCNSSVGFGLEPARGSVALEGGLGAKVRYTVNAIIVSSTETSSMKWKVSLNDVPVCHKHCCVQERVGLGK